MKPLHGRLGRWRGCSSASSGWAPCLNTSDLGAFLILGTPAVLSLLQAVLQEFLLRGWWLFLLSLSVVSNPCNIGLLLEHDLPLL